MYNADTKHIIVNKCTVCILKQAKFQLKSKTFYLFKSVQNIYFNTI